MRTLVSLSGGMDSATLLGYMVKKYGVHDVSAVSFRYPSKHNKYELKKAISLSSYYDVYHMIVDTISLFQYTKSNLLQSGGSIPEGHYNEPTMIQTVVPGRNTIFASILASIAESNNFHQIALAVHAGDHHIYPDCRPEYINSLSETIFKSTEGKVAVHTPFIDIDKYDILKIGYSLTPNVPYQYTRTCYKDQLISCGKCGSCTERLEAFTKIGKQDPIQYEET